MAKKILNNRNKTIYKKNLDLINGDYNFKKITLFSPFCFFKEGS